MKDKPIQSGPVVSVSRPTKIILNPYEQIADFKGGIFNFSFRESILWMEEKGKILFGQHFAIDPDDKSLIYKLLVYAIGDRKNVAKQGLSLNKGFLFCGPIGCRKSSLLRLTSFFCPRETQFLIKPTREISFEFEQDGYPVINRYSKGSYFRIGGLPVPKVYCFDDLRLEQTPKYYGNRAVSEIFHGEQLLVRSQASYFVIGEFHKEDYPQGKSTGKYWLKVSSYIPEV